MKDFFNYIKNIYKESAWLLCRFVILAVYLTVSSILANKMQLVELTYFNSMIVVASFASIIGFGISNGIGIFVNQNINDNQKIDNYITFGLKISIIFSFILTLLLMVFYKPLLHFVFNLPYTIDYTFYFIMIGYVFVYTINEYLSNIKIKLKMMKNELILTVIKSFLIITTFFAIYKYAGLNLNLIGITYLLITCIIFYISLFSMCRSNVIKIKIESNLKSRINSKEMKIIIENIISDSVWQIGFGLTSLIILNVSEVYFNQHSYFENVLDIVNALYFGFVVINGIVITRSLGNGDFDSAYKSGKYSIIFSVLIWFVYASIVLIFSNPIISGMSSEIRDNVITTLVLYLLLYLLYFISWNLLSYVLCWGGKILPLMILEILCTSYFIALYLISLVVSFSLVSIYLLIMIPTIIECLFGLIWFFRKNWMVKLSKSD